ncbi:unnamed protein product [Caenorhabditis sp. 36 PRJEB53466]|nr:unnamed protein product [Caenorhabditis sp. 36 PRJEB53466]
MNVKGFIVWILMSTIFISCYAKAMPVKRRMVLRLPFVHNQESSQNTFQQRTFLRMLNGNSKIKKADYVLPEDFSSDDNYVYMFRQII